MIPFGGKVCFKVYNPDKPDKCGVKSNRTMEPYRQLNLRTAEFPKCCHQFIVELGWNHPGTGRLITKLEIIYDYNKFMVAIDKCDQNLTVAYSYFRQWTMKWWKKVFFHLFSLGNLNAYILYKQKTRSSVLQRTFQRELVKELVRNSGILPSLTPRGRPRRSAKGLTQLQAGGHFQRKYWALGRSSTSPKHVRFAFLPKGRSWQRDNRKRPGKESSIQCNFCKVALCMPDCFQLYNTVQDCVAA